MRVDCRPRKRNAPRLASKHAPQFLQWLRGRPCILAFNGECEGKTEAAHIDFAGGKGMGSKVAAGPVAWHGRESRRRTVAENIALTRKGKQLWMLDKMVADCASDGIAATLLLAVQRARIKQNEADVLFAVFK